MFWSNLLRWMSSPSNAFRPLATPADWSDALDASETEPVVVFKHSSACPVSGRAQRQMEHMADADDAPPIYQLVVQNSRALSNEVADALDVRHETPQAIILKDRRPVFDASHGRVKADVVREAVASATSRSAAASS